LLFFKTCFQHDLLPRGHSLDHPLNNLAINWSSSLSSSINPDAKNGLRMD
jgi:hypothetical protein